MGRSNLIIHFQDVFEKLLDGEFVDLYAEDVSLMFQGIAHSLLGAVPGRERCYFDGVTGLTAKRKSPRQVQFDGDMWIGHDRDSSQWTESFKAIVTDKRCTKQGIWVCLVIGEDRAEASLAEAFSAIK